MNIKGIDSMTHEELLEEIDRGGKFVYYLYCVSPILLTFKRPSDIYFIRSGESAFKRGIGFSAMSMALGWWGIPWGFIYTIEALVHNSTGGKNVTQEVLDSIRAA